jgi:hypothetical protein
MRKIGG